jgi:hypothetical protein
MVNSQEAPPDVAPETEVDRHISDAVYAQLMLERARAVVEQYQAARDASIRAAAALGADRTRIGREVGLSRRLVYVAIEARGDQDSQLMEWFDQKANAAYAEWHAAGEKGSLDDYWDL